MNHNDFINGSSRVENELNINKENIFVNLYFNNNSVFKNKKTDVRRCGVIFIKDFVENIDTYIKEGLSRHKAEYDEPPKKIRKILFVKGKSGYYSFPKGRMKEGETDYECASREVYEETGIRISESFLKILPVLKIDNNIYFICNLNNVMVNIEGKYSFIVDFIGKKVKFDDNFIDHLNFWSYNNKSILDPVEIEEACWHTLEEIVELKANKDIRNVIKKLNRTKDIVEY
jgi:8-oxo-dGTP pyrophosphatase MutT (NUDIX family)